ncbi:MAG: pyruvate formate lyase family protein, partial [Candidatus Methanomethyliaceae archaeon]
MRGRELERIKKMASKIRRSGFIFCIEKARMITDVYKATEGEPEILRQAKAFARVLDNLPIWIDEDETIVGHGSSKPWGIDPDLFHSVLKEEDIRELEKQGSIIVDERDWPQIKEVFDYWRTKSVEYRVGHVYSEEEFKFMQTGVWLPPTTNRHIQGGAFAGNGLGLYQGFHLNVPDYPRVLNYGLLDVIREAQSELEKLKLFTRDDIEKKCFLEAVIISLNAIIRLAHRYAKLAEEMASKENDPLRKKELERIAETCRWVPANPARTFYEAIQSFWFIYLVVNLTSMGMGRFDQYMYPFYKRDKDSGRITDEEVLALLCELRIKDMELVRIALRSEKRKQRAGDFQAKWHNMIIGGVTPDGRDATNELTYLVLEAAKIVRTPH